MAYHKGTTRGINRASGTADTRPSKVWGTERLPTQEKKDLILYSGIVILKN